MTKPPSKTSQLLTAIKVHEVKKEQLMHQLHQMQEAIKKKQESIEQFEAYAKAYSQQRDVMTVSTIQGMTNNLNFYQNLTKIIVSEKKDLCHYQDIKNKLIDSCVNSINKTDGLKTLHQSIDTKEKSKIEQLEETKLMDLLSWNH